MSQSRVLIISYWFPPAGGIAVQRALSLAKYLPQYGCEVHVLAPSNPPSPVPDPSLLAQIPAQVRVHRAWTPSPPSAFRKGLWSLISRKKGQPKPKAEGSQAAPAKGSAISKVVRRILSPDPEVVWVPFAKRRARAVVRQYQIDSVLVTAPPFSAFLVGNALKREFPHLRLITDFRDEWLRFFVSTFDFQKSDEIRRRAERIERATVELSDHVVTVTSALVEELRLRYSDQPADKFVHIPNGYDPALFAEFSPRRHETSKVVVAHIGTVYSASSPRFYLDALDALPDDLRDRIETRFVGRIAEDQLPLLQSRKDVNIVGYVKQREALLHMEEADYLMLTMTDPTATTGKIYEYLATGKPILAFSPKGGEVDRTLRETGAGWCLDPADKAGIEAILRALVSGELARDRRVNWAAIRAYERPRQSEKFAGLMCDTQCLTAAK